MSTVECVVCDYEIELPDLITQRGLTGVEVPTQEYLGMVTSCEANMAVHLDGHTVADFVESLRKADEYIAKIEGELSQAEAMLASLKRSPSQGLHAPPITVPDEWAQGLQSPVVVKDEPRRVPPSEENPHGLRYPNGRPSLRPPGRMGS